MANAARDPLFLAALSVAEQDSAGSGQFCLRCHTPKGFVKGNATGIGQQLDTDDLEGRRLRSMPPFDKRQRRAVGGDT